MAAPDPLAEMSDFLLHRGRRPYMAHFDIRRATQSCLQLRDERVNRRSKIAPKQLSTPPPTAFRDNAGRSAEVGRVLATTESSS